MARVLKPPDPLSFDDTKPSVFLAGSIEMGSAVDWQSQMEQGLSDLDVVILNPRRDEWDATWVQSIRDSQFRGQVEWELEALERTALVAMYFAPHTKATVTLLELGLMARTGKLLVCCPQGFWRRGNVEIVCARYGVPLVNELADLVGSLRARLSAIRGQSALLTPDS